MRLSGTEIDKKTSLQKTPVVWNAWVRLMAKLCHCTTCRTILPSCFLISRVSVRFYTLHVIKMCLMFLMCPYVFLCNDKIKVKTGEIIQEFCSLASWPSSTTFKSSQFNFLVRSLWYMLEVFPQFKTVFCQLIDISFCGFVWVLWRSTPPVWFVMYDRQPLARRER